MFALDRPVTPGLDRSVNLNSDVVDGPRSPASQCQNEVVFVEHHIEGSHPSCRLQRLVLTLRRTFFKSTASMLRETRLSERGSVGPKYCHFSQIFLDVSLALKHVRRPTTGLASWLAIGHEVKLMPPT
jgi:hypothetical protein